MKGRYKAMKKVFAIIEEGTNTILCRIETNNGKNALKILSKNLISSRMERIYKQGELWHMDTTIGRYFIAKEERKI